MELQCLPKAIMIWFPFTCVLLHLLIIKCLLLIHLLAIHSQRGYYYPQPCLCPACICILNDTENMCLKDPIMGKTTGHIETPPELIKTSAKVSRWKIISWHWFASLWLAPNGGFTRDIKVSHPLLFRNLWISGLKPPMRDYFDWSASIVFVMLLVHLPKKPFKFGNKDTALNPVATGANINLFLTFPRAQISLITSIFFPILLIKVITH